MERTCNQGAIQLSVAHQNIEQSGQQNYQAFELQQHMAVAIGLIIKASGNCVPGDLEAKGFTAEEIAHCWPMAKALAHVMLDVVQEHDTEQIRSS
jgi:hypothetical protein